MALLLALIIADCRTNSYGPQPDPSHPAANAGVLALGFVLVTGLLQPLLPFLAVLLSCARLPGLHWAVLHGVLTCAPLRWVADVSYDVYLLHPIVIMAVWTVLPPSQWFDPKQALPFAGVTGLVVALSLATAWLHGRAVAGLINILESRICSCSGGKKTG